MEHHSRPAGPSAPTEELDPSAGTIERWRARSAATGWADPGDWWAAAAQALAEAVVGERDATGAAERLGRARGAAGVGVAEALTDLWALYDTTEDGRPPLEVVTAFTEGWADVSTGAALPSPCEDAATGLATREHLATRIREVMRDAAVGGGEPPTRSHVLAVLDARQGAVDHADRCARDAELGRTLRDRFPDGVGAELGPGRVAALVRRTIRTAAELERARAAVDGDARTGVVRSWLEPLPTDAVNPRVWLRDLAR